MKSRIGAGIIAGVIAGVVFGVVESLFHATLSDGTIVSNLGLVGRVFHTDSIAASWAGQLVGCAVLGGIFGSMFYKRSYTMRSALVWGLLYGIVFWILDGLLAIPAATQVPVGQIAWSGLLGWAIFGLILGPLFRALYRPNPVREMAKDIGRKVGV